MSIGFNLKSPLAVASDLRVYCLEADVAFSSWVPRRHFVSKGFFCIHWQSCLVQPLSLGTQLLLQLLLPHLHSYVTEMASFLSHSSAPAGLRHCFYSSLTSASGAERARPLPWLRLWLGNAVTGFIFCLDTSSILTSLFHFPTIPCVCWNSTLFCYVFSFTH